MPLDRDAARGIIDRSMPVSATVDEILDALEGCVRPAPPQTIDRDALWQTLSLIHGLWPVQSPEVWEDRILALLRPADGVILSRDELRLVLGWWAAHLVSGVEFVAPSEAEHRALAARLEAAS